MTQKVTTWQGLTPRQELFLQSLLAGNTILVSAAAARVSNKTAHQWLKQERFQQALAAAQRRVFNAYITNLSLGSEASLRALARHIQAEDVEPTAQTQVAAAKFWGQQYLEAVRTNEIQEKLDMLEKLLKERGLLP